MKGKINLVVGLLCLVNVVYYVIACPSFSCDEDIFGIQMSGAVYVIFWTVLSAVILYGVYQENSNKKVER